VTQLHGSTNYQFIAERGSGCPNINETIAIPTNELFIGLKTVDLIFILGSERKITMMGKNGTCSKKGFKVATNGEPAIIVGIIIVVILALIIAVLSHFFWTRRQQDYKTIQGAKITYGHNSNL